MEKKFRLTEAEFNSSIPCLDEYHFNRLLEEENDDSADTILWEVIYTVIVLLFMLVALLSDKIGADHIMLTSLTLYMVSGIISAEEGLEGFANEGVATVMILFVVAQGISATGALDWYMGKLLGKPNSIASAQVRLMIPIAIISAFLNNTPVVAVMIPILQRWGKTIGVSPQQLLIPLSFASILGGTCTLIGTSTNLVVAGLLTKRYPDDPTVVIGLFDLGEYGVPVAIIGLSYILIASPFLLPGARHQSDSVDILGDGDDLLLGARLTQWSPAAGRSVKRSGLRDTGGIFLVSVHRARTGNVHRAVGQDFVLNVGDILYFTGLVEGFGDFCEEHGMELVTNESPDIPEQAEEDHHIQAGEHENTTTPMDLLSPVPKVLNMSHLSTVNEVIDEEEGIPGEVGLTAASLMQADEHECLRSIHQMTDQIRGISSSSVDNVRRPTRKRQISVDSAADPPKIVVTFDSHDTQRLVLVGIDSKDRPGLLLDISKGLLRLNLQLRHTEAAVVDDRSLSIWRCEVMGADLPETENIWSVLNALLETESGVDAIKKRGLRVVRAKVTKHSMLIGKKSAEVDFRQTYKAAIVAIQHHGKNIQGDERVTFKFSVGDVLIVQASPNSPLLTEPPEGFYKKIAEAEQGSLSKPNSMTGLVNMIRKNLSSASLQDASGHGRSDDSVEIALAPKNADEEGGNAFYIPDGDEAPNLIEQSEMNDASEANQSVAFNTEQMEAAWRDLQVVFSEGEEQVEMGGNQREFLSAMQIASGSEFVGKNAAKAGIAKLPGVFLVSIERPLLQSEEKEVIRSKRMVVSVPADTASAENFSVASVELSLRENQKGDPRFITIEPDELLQGGDVLWFAGSASAVGDLRKIPGLISFDNDQVEKINEKVHDRRLVQAVVARKGPLVGKTVREVRFRTKYGAAVISVHREGKRVHDHPGQIRLQAGDVLLLEAGPTFIERNNDNDRSFALLAEVSDSAPPRLAKFVPAMTITVM